MIQYLRQKWADMRFIWRSHRTSVARILGCGYDPGELWAYRRMALEDAFDCLVARPLRTFFGYHAKWCCLLDMEDSYSHCCCQDTTDGYIQYDAAE